MTRTEDQIKTIIDEQGVKVLLRAAAFVCLQHGVACALVNDGLGERMWDNYTTACAKALKHIGDRI